MRVGGWMQWETKPQGALELLKIFHFYAVITLSIWMCVCVCVCVHARAKLLQSCPTLLRPHRQQPTRLPRSWDSLGKNTGVGCHFLLQCMKVKSSGLYFSHINGIIIKHSITLIINEPQLLHTNMDISQNHKKERKKSQKNTVYVKFKIRQK